MSEEETYSVVWMQSLTGGRETMHEGLTHRAAVEKMQEYSLNPINRAPGVVWFVEQEEPHVEPGEELPTLSINPINLRPELSAFACVMEEQLRRNDHKPGWDGEDPIVLFKRLMEESAELLLEIADFGANAIRPESIAREAADVANFAFFIADRCARLQHEKE